VRHNNQTDKRQFPLTDGCFVFYKPGCYLNGWLKRNSSLTGKHLSYCIAQRAIPGGYFQTTGIKSQKVFNWFHERDPWPTAAETLSRTLMVVARLKKKCVNTAVMMLIGPLQ
jgi:hypothetical protein